MEEAGWRGDGPEAYCHRCGSSVGPGEATTTGCGSCRNGGGIADGIVRLGAYGGVLREWIIAVKYVHRWTEMAELLGRELGRAVAREGVVEAGRAVVVPMPMPWQRRMYRGIDHARVIAWGVAGSMRAPLVGVLGQSNGPPQVSLPRGERERSGGRHLRVRRPLGRWKLAGLDVVLVDDVRTSGASLRHAVWLLRRLKPARIVAAVVAVADDYARRDRGERPGVSAGRRKSGDEKEASGGWEGGLGGFSGTGGKRVALI